MNQTQESTDYLSKLPPELINLILLYVGNAKPLTVNTKLRGMLSRTETVPFWKYRLRHDFPTFSIPNAPANYQQLYRDLARKEKSKSKKKLPSDFQVHRTLDKLIHVNDLEEIKKLVQKENIGNSSLIFLFNTKDVRPITAIRLAGLLDRRDILEYIFGLFVDAYFKEPGVRDPSGETRHYWAACCGMVAEFEHFPEPIYGGSTTIKDSCAILKAAISHGYNDIVDFLLKAKIKPDYSGPNPSPLAEAAKVGNLYATRTLLAAVANWQELGYLQQFENTKSLNPLWIAAKNGHNDIVKELLAKGAKPIIDKYGNTIIYIAAKHGHAEVVKLFAGSDICVDTVGKNKQTPLYIAACNGHADVVSVLLQAKANIDYAPNGETALCAASRLGHVDVVQILVANHALLDKRTDDAFSGGKSSALHLAAAYNNLQVVNTLLMAKADVNAKNMIDETPLHLAAAKGHLPIVKALLLAGACYTFNTFGTTALDLAVSRNNITTVKLMLDQGAPINISSKGSTPLHIAAACDNLELINILLDKGSDLNIVAGGNTPLHAAIQNDCIEAMKILLAAGAFVNLATGFELALHLAIKKNKKIPLIKLLLEAGADINLKNKMDNDALTLAKSPEVSTAIFSLLTLWKVKQSTSQLSLRERLKAIIAATISRTSTGGSWLSLFFDTPETKLIKLLDQIKLPADQADTLQILREFIKTHRSILGEEKYTFITDYILIEQQQEHVLIESAKVKLI